MTALPAPELSPEDAVLIALDKIARRNAWDQGLPLPLDWPDDSVPGENGPDGTDDETALDEMRTVLREYARLAVLAEREANAVIAEPSAVPSEWMEDANWPIRLAEMKRIAAAIRSQP